MRHPLFSFLVMTLAVSTLGCDQDAPRKAHVTAPTPPPAGGPRVLIAFDSFGGNTEAMAQAVAEGARRIENVEVHLSRLEALEKKDIDAAGGLILGAPTHFAGLPGRTKMELDRWGREWKIDLSDKFGGAFSTGGGLTGGKEGVVTSLLLFMINSRMLVAGPLYENSGGKWGEIGATATTGHASPGLDEEELDGARRLGERVAVLVASRHK